MAKGGRAGGSAEEKYKELTRSWRRRKRKVFLVVAAVCLLLGAGAFLGSLWKPDLSFMFGVWAGVALCFWFFARSSPPGWIENWQTGAFGEQDTAKQLRPLEREGWVVVHDLRHGEKNVDHVVIGPGGVFLLDSKRHDGVVTVDGPTVTVRRIDDPDMEYRHTGSKHVVALALATHDRVLAVSRIRTWVTPVMVLWADFPQKVVQDRCTYVSGEELANWLRSQPQKVAPERVPQLAEAVQAGWSLAGHVG